MFYPEPIKNLIESFTKLPGIGRKTAERFVFYLLKQNKQDVEKFSQRLSNLHRQNFTCPECFNFSDQSGKCSVCRNDKRDHQTICVVEEIHDLNIIESTGEYHGLYHVLGGKIDPPEGITPDKLTLKKLIERLRNNNIKEIILAINPDLQGEGTIIYLKKLFSQSQFKVKVSILARGLPMGADIEYADEATLSNALKGRQEIK